MLHIVKRLQLQDLSSHTTHRYGLFLSMGIHTDDRKEAGISALSTLFHSGPNTFKLHRLPTPRPGPLLRGGNNVMLAELFVCFYIFFSVEVVSCL